MVVVPAGTKVVKKNGKTPSEIESSISQALLDLESTSDLKPQLCQLHIVGAKEVDAPNRKVSNRRTVTVLYYTGSHGPRESVCRAWSVACSSVLNIFSSSRSSSSCRIRN